MIVVIERKDQLFILYRGVTGQMCNGVIIFLLFPKEYSLQ